MRLLLTRPEPDAQRTAAALRAKGHTVAVAPLMHIEAAADVQFDDGPWAAHLITSANAVRAIARHVRIAALRPLPVFAIGRRTAQALLAAGFRDVGAADGNVDDLARLVAGRVEPGARLLYLAGEDRSGDLAGNLRRRGFTVETRIVYRAIAATVLPAAAAAALAEQVDAVLHFSRRSAETFLRSASAAGALANALRPTHFCLSAQVAEPLVRAGAASVRVASRPAEAALIGLVDSA